VLAVEVADWLSVSLAWAILTLGWAVEPAHPNQAMAKDATKDSASAIVIGRRSRCRGERGEAWDATFERVGRSRPAHEAVALKRRYVA
jgi:hypothetical protein